MHDVTLMSCMWVGARGGGGGGGAVNDGWLGVDIEFQ